jgi:hypothetical protein
MRTQRDEAAAAEVKNREALAGDRKVTMGGEVWLKGLDKLDMSRATATGLNSTPVAGGTIG